MAVILKRRNQRTLIEKTRYKPFFMAKVMAEQDELPRNEEERKYQHSRRMQALVADNINTYLNDIMDLPAQTEESVAMAAVRLGQRIQKYNNNAKAEIILATEDYIDRLADLERRKPTISRDDLKLTILLWLGEDYGIR